MTVSPPETRATYQLGLVRGLQDARLLADGLQPRGPGVPLAYPHFTFHRGYRAGLSRPVTLVQRASVATQPPQDVPWRGRRGDHERSGHYRPGPWQFSESGTLGTYRRNMEASQ